MSETIEQPQGKGEKSDLLGTSRTGDRSYDLLVEELMRQALPNHDSDALRAFLLQFVRSFAPVIADWARTYQGEVEVSLGGAVSWENGSYDTGSAQQILRSVVVGIGNLEGDVNQLGTYLSQHVARSLHWYAKKDGGGGADSEQVVDLAVMILSRLQVDASWSLAAMGRLVPKLWVILNRKTSRDSGWLITLSSLGVLYSVIRDRVTIPEEKRRASIDGIGYYQAALAIGAGRSWPQGAPVDENETPPQMRPDVLGQAANNLAACLAELRDMDLACNQDNYKKIMACLANLAMGAVPRVRGAPQGSAQQQSKMGILQKLGMPENMQAVPDDVLSLLDRMMMVSTLLPLDKGTSETSWAYICAAVARCVQQVEDRAAAAFFNAGVQLARIQATGGGGHNNILTLETFLYGLGFFWAIHLNAGEGKALGEGDGLDCAVKFINTLPDPAVGQLGSFGRYLRDALQRNETVLNPNEMARAALALQKKWPQGLDDVTPSKDPQKDVVKVVTPMLEEINIPGFSWSSESDCADALVMAFDAVFTTRTRERNARKVVGLVRNFLRQKTDIAGLLRDNYDPALFSPMVAVTAGFITEDKWAERREILFPASYAGDIGQAFHEAFSQDRGRGGGRGR